MVWSMYDAMTYYGKKIPVGRLPWLCNIYIGLALRDAFKLVLCFKFCVVMCLQLTVLCSCPMSFGRFW